MSESSRRSRVTEESQLSWYSESSRVSSMVSTFERGGTNIETAFIDVVLPAAVPPAKMSDLLDSMASQEGEHLQAERAVVQQVDGRERLVGVLPDCERRAPRCHLLAQGEFDTRAVGEGRRDDGVGDRDVTTRSLGEAGRRSRSVRRRRTRRSSRCRCSRRGTRRWGGSPRHTRGPRCGVVHQRVDAAVPWNER